MLAGLSRATVDKVTASLSNESGALHLGRLDEIRERVTERAGQKGDGNSALNGDLKPNTDHSVKGYTYKTDADGRVQIVEAGKEDWFHISDNKDGLMLVRALRALRAEMFDQTGDKWNEVRFTVKNDMTFNAEFKYH